MMISYSQNLRPSSKDLIATIGVLFSSILLLGLDQLIKVIAVHYLVPGQSVAVISLPVVGDVCLLVLVWNTGAFLSLGTGLGGIFYVFFMIAIPALALLGMLAYLFRPWWSKNAKKSPASLRLTLLFALAGGAGNLVDRIREGKVVDFLNFGIGPIRTGIMNVADLYILFGLISLLVFYFRHYRKSEMSNTKPSE